MTNRVCQLAYYSILLLWRVDFDREISEPVGCLDFKSPAQSCRHPTDNSNTEKFPIPDQRPRHISLASPSVIHCPHTQLVYRYISHLLSPCISFQHTPGAFDPAMSTVLSHCGTNFGVSVSEKSPRTRRAEKPDHRSSPR